MFRAAGVFKNAEKYRAIVSCSDRAVLSPGAPPVRKEAQASPLRLAVAAPRGSCRQEQRTTRRSSALNPPQRSELTFRAFGMRGRCFPSAGCCDGGPCLLPGDERRRVAPARYIKELLVGGIGRGIEALVSDQRRSGATVRREVHAAERGKDFRPADARPILLPFCWWATACWRLSYDAACAATTAHPCAAARRLRILSLGAVPGDTVGLFS